MFDSTSSFIVASPYRHVARALATAAWRSLEKGLTYLGIWKLAAHVTDKANAGKPLYEAGKKIQEGAGKVVAFAESIPLVGRLASIPLGIARVTDGVMHFGLKVLDTATLRVLNLEGWYSHVKTLGVVSSAAEQLVIPYANQFFWRPIERGAALFMAPTIEMGVRSLNTVMMDRLRAVYPFAGGYGLDGLAASWFSAPWYGFSKVIGHLFTASTWISSNGLSLTERGIEQQGERLANGLEYVYQQGAYAMEVMHGTGEMAIEMGQAGVAQVFRTWGDFYQGAVQYRTCLSQGPNAYACTEGAVAGMREYMTPVVDMTKSVLASTHQEFMLPMAESTGVPVAALYAGLGVCAMSMMYGAVKYNAYLSSSSSASASAGARVDNTVVVILHELDRTGQTALADRLRALPEEQARTEILSALQLFRAQATAGATGTAAAAVVVGGTPLPAAVRIV